MILKIITFLCTMVFIVCLSAQEKVEIQGAIILAGSNDVTPKAGTLRFNTAARRFEGYDGRQWVSLTNLTDDEEVLIDIEGNRYATVRIGNQLWMAENLRSTRFKNNVPINFRNPVTGVLHSHQWVYDDNDTNNDEFLKIYGRLYDWSVVRSGDLCPSGWYIPSIWDWVQLRLTLGNGQFAGGRMKETGTEFWLHPNSGATNESNYNGRPGGRRIPDGRFEGVGLIGHWWSATEYNEDPSKVWVMRLSNLDKLMIEQVYPKEGGYSVRCIKS